MNYFVILAWDVAYSAPRREKALAAHFAHIETVMDHIAVAGPLKNDSGGNIGSMFVLKVDSVADAEAILKVDPYFKAGVWERWTIHPFVGAAGEWVGGKTW
jgi:uncharacterized protein